MIRIEEIPGRRFEAAPATVGCVGCAFRPNGNSTLTEDEKVKGCDQMTWCGDAGVVYKEVGFDPANT